MVEATVDVEDPTGEFMERMTALRAALAGRGGQRGRGHPRGHKLRCASFTLRRLDAENALRRFNVEQGVDAPYVVEPRVNKAARLGTMPAGTPIVSRSPL